MNFVQVRVGDGMIEWREDVTETRRSKMIGFDRIVKQLAFYSDCKSSRDKSRPIHYLLCRNENRKFTRTSQEKYTYVWFPENIPVGLTQTEFHQLT